MQQEVSSVAVGCLGIFFKTPTKAIQILITYTIKI